MGAMEKDYRPGGTQVPRTHARRRAVPDRRLAVAPPSHCSGASRIAQRPLDDRIGVEDRQASHELDVGREPSVGADRRVDVEVIAHARGDHDFFDADSRILVADVGHYESESLMKGYIAGLLSKKFTNFASVFSKIDTNPISYL